MCGITGFWGGQSQSKEIAAKMAAQIVSRGPDDCGVWRDANTNCVLAHRRLSVIDLSAAGHQPMLSPCRRYVLSYNGEIYNHEELRAELQLEAGAFHWRGHSDTETLLAALRHWGTQRTLQKINGMFAFALWDTAERQLTLARDRMGEKPLYYGRNGDVFLFGSELKALASHPEWRPEINRDALALYMRHGYIPAPWSIYRGIYKLPPAHFTVIRNGRQCASQPTCYWDILNIAAHATSDMLDADAEHWIDEAEVLVRDAVKRRMTADVPLGALLSGGIDSTLITACMQAQTTQPIRTFTIGFREAGYNEATYAREIAEYLGTHHTELYVDPQDASEVIPNLPNIYDEPFADSSQIPTYLVSKLARRHVTVSLSGDGGDELFYGYNRYFQTNQLWKLIRTIPYPLRKALQHALSSTKSTTKLESKLPATLQARHLTDRAFKLSKLLAHTNGEALYHGMISSWIESKHLLRCGAEPTTLFAETASLQRLPSLHERMLLLDMSMYLPGDILTKIDRASMAVSLENRAALLDHRLVELSWRIPTQLKYLDGKGKWVLREMLARYIPRSLVDRKKRGFSVPIEHWLRGPLRSWAEELLNEQRLRTEGFFQPEPVRQMWHEHLSGRRRWHACLWSVLMFQAWYARWHV